ncbi:DUF2737 family protein [Cronobacter sakazakii]|nr:DUF2737 family protein [Cronobacter sakazakii]NHV32529.1 DUF2737 family protein [Cronobacter sakazakii]
MITHDPLITPSELQARVKSQPMPSREELMKRNSFGDDFKLTPWRPDDQ